VPPDAEIDVINDAWTDPDWERDCDLLFISALHSDVDRVRQISHYCRRRGARTVCGGVVVGCRRTSDGFRVEVWDTAIGVPENERGHIFEEFYQLANPERNTKKGMRLGLAIIRRIADLPGYRLLVTSVVGSGTRFAMDVPRGRITSTPGPATASGESVARDLRGRVIAVIDDEEAILEGMRVLLDGWGCTVVAAPSLATGIAGLQVLGRAPDLVVTDYRLQDGADGIAAIEGLRARYGKALAAILATGSTTQEPTAVAARYDADLLHKPVTPGKLRALVAAKRAQVPRLPAS
jgi:CheY-like chemotaxis protein